MSDDFPNWSKRGATKDLGERAASSESKAICADIDATWDNPMAAQPAPREWDVAGAKQILDDYKKPSEAGSIDIGNVYYAATQLEAALDAAQAEVERLRYGHYKDDHRYHPLKEECDALQAKCERLEAHKEVLVDMRADRNAWREQVERLAGELAALMPEVFCLYTQAGHGRVDRADEHDVVSRKYAAAKDALAAYEKFKRGEG